MRLQISLDVLDLEKAVRIASETADLAERIEVGTLLLRRYGMEAIRKMRHHFEGATIVADCKTMDCGREETEMAVDAGADVVTVMAAAPAATLEAVCETAVRLGAKAYIDTLGIRDVSSLASRTKNLPFELVLLHRGRDEQQLEYRSPELGVAGIPSSSIGLAGGFTANNVALALGNFRPQLIVVGQGIVAQENPRAAATRIRAALDLPTK